MQATKIKCVDCRKVFILLSEAGDWIVFCPYCGGEAIGKVEEGDLTTPLT